MLLQVKNLKEELMKFHERATRGRAVLGHVGRWVPPPRPHPSLVSSYRPSVRERPPRCLISYIIRETAGGGCRQLTRGCRGRISCDFLEGLGGSGVLFRSYVGVSGYPTDRSELQL